MIDKTDNKNLLLDAITRFCAEKQIAESTFGKMAVNDGKFVARLRNGSRVTPETWDRIAIFLEERGGPTPGRAESKQLHVLPSEHATDQAAPSNSTPGTKSKKQNFRFFDNRQKYLLFISTCSEKEVVASRVGMELSNLRPTPPAVRIFDAGMGDASVLTRVLRESHRRFPTMPFYVSCKEISMEDVRLSLSKMSDRFFEHPSTVLIVTNMYYSEAPWLAPKSVGAANAMIWKEVRLQGTSAFSFDEQLRGLDGFLAEHWQAKHSPKTGNPIYERPVVLVIYREDYQFLLHDVIPRQGEHRADFDLVIASQPYRSRMPASFKAEKVVTPLTRALAPGGRLLGIHSCGNDPGLEIIRKVWPNEEPFRSGRHDILLAVKAELGADARRYNFNAYSDKRAIFRYDMHALPSEISESIGTSTLFAAWNAAVYVAQIEDVRLTEAMQHSAYLEATNEVLKEHGGLWFNDESYIISRKWKS